LGQRYYEEPITITCSHSTDCASTTKSRLQNGDLVK
jgi:hypothetical protein